MPAGATPTSTAPRIGRLGLLAGAGVGSRMSCRSGRLRPDCSAGQRKTVHGRAESSRARRTPHLREARLRRQAGRFWEGPSLPSSCETASAVGLLSLRASTDVMSCRVAVLIRDGYRVRARCRQPSKLSRRYSSRSQPTVWWASDQRIRKRPYLCLNTTPHRWRQANGSRLRRTACGRSWTRTDSKWSPDQAPGFLEQARSGPMKGNSRSHNAAPPRSRCTRACSTSACSG